MHSFIAHLLNGLVTGGYGSVIGCGQQHLRKALLLKDNGAVQSNRKTGAGIY
jgi:hypothetical protein